MILNIVSFPRSGNSFFSTQMLRFGSDWEFKGRPVKFRPVMRLFPVDIVAGYSLNKAPWNHPHNEDQRPTDYIADPDTVFVYKRHDYPDTFAGPRIYLLRDGRDVLLSYARFHIINRMKEAPSGANKDFLHGRVSIPREILNKEAERLIADPNGKWGDLVEAGVDHPNTVAVVKYEDMKRNGHAFCAGALVKAGYKVKSRCEPPTWGVLQKKAPDFYWQGRVGGYKRWLDTSVIQAFEAQYGKTLKRFHYT